MISPFPLLPSPPPSPSPPLPRCNSGNCDLILHSLDQVGALGDPVPLSFPLIRLPADASPIIQHHVPYTFCLRFLLAGLGLGFPVLLPVGCFHYIRLTDPLIGTESRRLGSGCSADPPERNPREKAKKTKTLQKGKTKKGRSSERFSPAGAEVRD